MTKRPGSARRHYIVLAFTVACGHVLAAGDATTQLPRNVRPLHYDVAIDPDPATLSFTGRVAIAIEVLQPTSRITLNAADVKFTRVALSGVPGRDSAVIPLRTDMRAGDQTATFTFGKRIQPGHYELALDYSGRISTQAYGLFAVDYANATGPKRMLATQFESGDARRVIPCWDEPSYKATFTLQVDSPADMTTVSNMPAAGSDDLGGGRKRTRFMQTPKMSSYLVFFAVGDFDRTTTTVDGVEVGVVTQRGLAPQASFVLESSRAILHEYNDYFGIPYALPKLDNVAVPGESQQFSAMENWGAILTFENAILLDPAIASEADAQYSFGTAAHETAHQWFGNLVTMQWWDDLWLNEGFASWMDERMEMRLHPEWNTALQAVGVRERAMESAANLPVSAIAKDFTLQPGVPLIRVESAACEAGETKLRLSQGEYSKDQPGKRPLRWRVPVIAATVGGAGPTRTLVSGGTATMSVPGCGPLIVNAGQGGYYRTLYGTGPFARIAGSFSTVAPIDQLGILADSWALGLAGLQPATDFLDLAAATPVDADPQVWHTIAGVLGRIDDYYSGLPARQARFRQVAAGLLTPVLARTGWAARPGEPSAVAILRNALIETLGALGDPGVVGEARRRYAAQQTDPAAIPAPLRLSILRVVARHADAATWDQLHAAALAEKSPLVRDRYYELLAATQDVELARRALDLALTPEPGATVSANMITDVGELHADLAFDFALDNLAAVMEKVDGPSQTRYLPVLAGRSADPKMIRKINAYAAAHLPPNARRDASTAAANVAYRVKVRNERLPAIDAWLASRQ